MFNEDRTIAISVAVFLSQYTNNNSTAIYLDL